MAKKPDGDPKSRAQNLGNGGETHRQADKTAPALTTDQGLPIGDNQNSLRLGERGPG